ncbi:syntaxin-18 [Condylostylus longicornis]|uniref:syntaxin-18 n=1 Tax=Condylostylus longicornis TaxID=2530218 RepID=UPI00244E4AF1|nr:syntaxin-18 [Condylostylus longicornis]XP_055384372.1 syntaxin-18 [Condylostylus longicornis]
MDLTPVFKASIMAVKMRKKNLPKPDKNRILQPKLRDEFSKQAKEVCQNITALRDLLIENRAAYMRFASHLKSSAHMTDEERDLIDRESEKLFNYYTQYLGQLRSDWKKGKTKNHHQLEHIESVIDLLSSYLKAVHNLHLSQKKYRMQYELDTYKFLKLAADKKKIPFKPGSRKIVNGKLNKLEDSLNSSSDLSDYDDAEELNKTVQSNTEQKTINSPQKVALDEAMNESTYDDNVSELSPEDVQMYESENVQLYNELQGLAEEVEQIEKNVVDIARLQEIFTEKIVLQKHDIERIANAVVGATENVKDANEQIKQAIQRNAGLRVWTLFFLLVISFTLLFLDWYND